MISRGIGSTLVLSSAIFPPGGSTTNITLFSLHNGDFIGSFETRDHEIS